MRTSFSRLYRSVIFAACMGTATLGASASAIYSTTDGMLSAPILNIPGAGAYAITFKTAAGERIRVGTQLTLANFRPLNAEDKLGLPSNFSGADGTVSIPGLAVISSDGLIQYFDATLTALAGHVPMVFTVTSLADPSAGRGAQGPKGDRGDKGERGAEGPRGPAGADGAGGSGPAGPQGPAGPAGATGPAGPQGPAGAPGSAGTGTPGPTGPAGPQGPAGAMGPAGPAGPAGANGTAGAPGATGPAGPTGATGPAGPQGPAGTSLPKAFLSAYVLGTTINGSGASIVFSNSEELASGVTFDGVAARINTTGIYRVTYHVNIANPSAQSMAIEPLLNGALLERGKSLGFQPKSLTNSFLVSLTTGDVIRLTVTGVGGSSVTLDNTSFTLQLIAQ